VKETLIHEYIMNWWEMGKMFLPWLRISCEWLFCRLWVVKREMWWLRRNT